MKRRKAMKRLNARQQWFDDNVDGQGHPKRIPGSDPPGVYNRPGSNKK